MLPEKHRLKLPVRWAKTEPQFQWKTPFFKVVATNNNGQMPAKVGFIITTKVGKAVVRHQIKRNLSKSIKEQLAKLPAGLEMIWIIYPTFTKAKNEDLSLSINKTLSKLSQHTFR